MEIAERVFYISNELPRKEDYSLTSQIRRSATSISANIAEGYGRRSSADKRRFYDYARGSAHETKSHLFYGQRVGYFPANQVEKLIEELNEVIFALNKISKSLR